MAKRQLCGVFESYVLLSTANWRFVNVSEEILSSMPLSLSLRGSVSLATCRAGFNVRRADVRIMVLRRILCKISARETFQVGPEMVSISNVGQEGEIEINITYISLPYGLLASSLKLQN